MRQKDAFDWINHVLDFEWQELKTELASFELFEIDYVINEAYQEFLLDLDCLAELNHLLYFFSFL